MADRSVKVTLTAGVDGFVNGMRTAKSAAGDFSRSATGYYRENQAQLEQIGSTAFKAGAGLTALAGFAVKSAMDWEQAWTGVLKTVEGTPQQLSAVEDGLRGLATETGFAHSEVAAVAEAAGQLGISTGGITAFTETMLAMGVSTNLSAEEAATGLARFRNIMGSSEAEIANMGSTIVALGNNFATTEGEILAMSMRIAGAGRQAGLTESDVLGIAAAMSSVGIEAEAGGTAMSLTMKRIGKEVESEGDKLGLFAETAGMTAQQFSDAWEKDAAGALTAFVKGLGETEAMGKSTNAVLSELGITGIREADALLRLSSNAEGLADALGESQDGWRQNIALMSEADKFYNTTGQKGKQAWAEIKDAAIDAGDALLPVVAQVLEGVGSLAGAFGSLPGPVKGGVTAIAGVAGVGLLAMSALIKLADVITTTKDAFGGLAASGRPGAQGMSMLASGATKATGALAALAAVQATAESVASRNSAEIRGLGKELEALAKSGKVGAELTEIFGKDMGGETRRFAEDMFSLGEAVNQFASYADDGFMTRMFKDGFQISNVNMREQTNALKDMDVYLTKLAQNKPDAAIETFEALRDRTLETGGSIEKLQDAFPGMTGLLESASKSMGGTADASELLSGNLQDLAPAAQASAEEMAAMQDAAQAIGESFFDAGEALEGSLSAFGDQLREQTAALKDFRQNAAEALQKGADETLVDYLIEQGPAGAEMLAQLADGTESAVDRMNDSWRGSRDQIAEWVEFQTGIPKEIVTEFSTPGAPDAVQTAIDLAGQYSELDEASVETILRALDYSSEDIAAVKAGIRNLNGDTAVVSINAVGNALSILSSVTGYMRALPMMGPINLAVNVARTVTTRNQTGDENGGFWDGPKHRADGGFDVAGRYVPRVPQLRNAAQGQVLWGEPVTGWEAYISGKPGMEDRNRGILAEAAERLGMQVSAFEDGGQARMQPFPSTRSYNVTVPTNPAATSAAFGPLVATTSLEGVRLRLIGGDMYEIARGVARTTVVAEDRWQGSSRKQDRGRRSRR